MRSYHLKADTTLEPQIYWTLTDNWLEIAARFVVEETGIRRVKDAISRDILSGFTEAGMGIASATFDITAFPPIQIERK